ncbi:ArsR/SmtB family transcription factor [Aurantimonas marianensis]|uniref:Metalloregulator ArsR/SmtB family transcription factor n=1 Tax=Aurantimonas marianensis TaxID=2920428 RepID=A0A9X2H5M1_9HYPH|nr:metalloregulator ArsR/SmtB family transcription factor [Aurantimonas marianensis]MCP3054260.1 metalloregulator ArsR/SmtB family transcription factor [Aurantimonas marianensis]
MSIGPKQALYAEFAVVAKALGSSHRLEMLEHLAQGERSVDGLAARVRLPLANVSHHLQQMKRAGLVAARRDGKFVRYRLADDAVLDLMAALSRLGTRTLAEVAQIRRSYFDARDTLEPVTRGELMARASDGRVTVLDVRPADEFASGHLPGAINVPAGELEARLGELDPGHEIVAYCRGPWCVFSFEVVAALRSRGLVAHRLEDGYPEWRAAGLPVETGA